MLLLLHHLRCQRDLHGCWSCNWACEQSYRLPKGGSCGKVRKACMGGVTERDGRDHDMLAVKTWIQGIV